MLIYYDNLSEETVSLPL